MLGGLFEEIRKEIEREVLEQKKKEAKNIQTRKQTIEDLKRQVVQKNQMMTEQKKVANAPKRETIFNTNQTNQKTSMATQKNLKEELIKKHGQKLSERKSMIAENEQSFEERYGVRKNFTNDLYKYSDEKPTEVLRTIQTEIEEVTPLKSKKKSFSKKLKNKVNAREAFINSVIFTRRNIGAK